MRHYQSLSILLLLIICLLCAGCGGGSGNSSTPQVPKVLGTTTSTVDSTGGTIAPPTSFPDTPTVVIPAGAINGTATVTADVLDMAPTPPANSDAVLLGNPVKIAISGAELADNSAMTVSMPGTLASDEHAVIGYERDGVWVAMPAVASGGNLTAELPTGHGDTVRKRGVILDTIIVVGLYKFPAFTVNTGDPPMETYQYNGSGWSVYNGNWKETTNEKVALLVHGVAFGSHDDLTPLAHHLKTKGYYSEIYAVEYHEGYGIIRLGAKLATYINSKVQAGKIDIFAHSMGGVVSRSAMELGTGKCYSKVNALVTMSSPHNGQSAAFLTSMLLNFGKGLGAKLPNLTNCIPEFYDLATGSAFFNTLNASPGHNTCHYRMLVGADANQPNGYWLSSLAGFGVPEAVRLPLTDLLNDSLVKDHDGMVEARSSGYPLGYECASYKSATLRLNHDWIKQHGDSYAIIDGWLNELYPTTPPPSTGGIDVTVD